MLKHLAKIIIFLSFLVSGNVFAHSDFAHTDSHGSHAHIHDSEQQDTHSHHDGSDDLSGLIHCGTSNIMCLNEFEFQSSLTISNLSLSSQIKGMESSIILQETPPPKHA